MKIIVEVEDRVRKDSTCVYFLKEFKKFAEVIKVYPEELKHIKPGSADLFIRIDYGIDNPFPKDLKPSAYYAIDTHIDPEWRIKMAKEADFDYIFCAQKEGTKLNWHTDKVYFTPLGCDPDNHRVLGERKKIYDIGFIGSVQSSWQQRRIERLDKLFKAVPNFYFGWRTFREMADKYAQCKIVFNTAHSNDINMRVFEAMCSGSMLLTDKQDWQGLFEPGKHFVEYTDEDMVEKALYYLEHDEEREKIAKAGQELIIEKHTYRHRVKEILEKCK